MGPCASHLHKGRCATNRQSGHPFLSMQSFVAAAVAAPRAEAWCSCGYFAKVPAAPALKVMCFGRIEREGAQPVGVCDICVARDYSCGFFCVACEAGKDGVGQVDEKPLWGKYGFAIFGGRMV